MQTRAGVLRLKPVSLTPRIGSGSRLEIRTVSTSAASRGGLGTEPRAPVASERCFECFRALRKWRVLG